MKLIRRKIMLASSVVMLLLITTVATTFAWFSMNDSAWVDSMELDIETSGNLYISSDSTDYPQYMKFQQYLKMPDIVEAINNANYKQITSLSQIKLKPITTLDCISFKEHKVTYDENNKEVINFVEADELSYLKMTVSFTVENNGSKKPNYNLKFALDDFEGVLGTKFISENQTITLVNELTYFQEIYRIEHRYNEDNQLSKEYIPTGKIVESIDDLTPEETKQLYDDKIALISVSKHTGEQLTVNPVNALRVAVINHHNEKKEDNLKIYLYDIGNSSKTNENSNVDIGSKATFENSIYHPSLTYFNNIHDCNIVPDFEYSDEQLAARNIELIKLNELDNNLGVFTANKNGVYNTITLTIYIWIEGDDADNLIGLDTSTIKALLTFVAEEE